MNRQFGPSPFPDAEARLRARLNADSPAPLAVAYSGGGDSLALLLMAANYGRETGRRVIALTVDHQLNPSSTEWTRQAQATAERIGVSWRGLDWTGSKPASGVAAAARTARHRLVASAARQEGCRVILMGHTADDLAEADLMRERDTPGLGSPREWAPSPVWPEGRGVFLLRPLLAVRRADLRLWLRSEGLDWIDDPANDSIASARARARRALAETPYTAPTPAAHPDATRLAGKVHFDVTGCATLGRSDLGSPAAQRVLGAAIVSVSGAEQPPRPDRLQTLLNRLTAGADLQATLGGARVQASGDVIRITPEPPDRRRAARSRDGVFEGRFEVSSGMTVRRVDGVAARLSAADQSALKTFPAVVRPTLAAIVEADGAVRLPAPFGPGPAVVHALAADRFAAACGLVPCERDAGPRTTGADGTRSAAPGS